MSEPKTAAERTEQIVTAHERRLQALEAQDRLIHLEDTYTLPPAIPTAVGLWALSSSATGVLSWVSVAPAAHNLLSATHTDTVVQAPTVGSLIMGVAGPRWDELVIGPNGSLLISNGTVAVWQAGVTRGSLLVGVAGPTWAELLVGAAGQALITDGTDVMWGAAPPAAHNLLSASHGDTAAGAVARGDVIVGNNTPAWSRLALGAAGSALGSDGNDVVYFDVLTPAEHTAIGDAAPHHAAVTLAASAAVLLDLAGQALSLDTQAANTVLAGPAAGAAAAPTFRALVDADISGLTAPTHGIVSAVHTGAGSALDVVGFSALNTLGVLTPSSDPGAASAILKSDANGKLELVTLYLQSTSDYITVSTSDLTVYAGSDDLVLKAADKIFMYPSGSASIAFQFDTSQAMPGVDNSINLGHTSYRWAALYCYDAHFYDDVVIDGDLTVSGTPNLGTYYTRTETHDWVGTLRLNDKNGTLRKLMCINT